MTTANLTRPIARPGARWRQLHWTVVLGIAGVHLLALAAPWTFTWTGLVLMLLLTWVTGGLGVALGYHRLLTHRSFRTPRWFEYLLTLVGSLAWQGGPVQWVGTHRLHHKHADEDADPHTPRHGFAWAHVFWCMHRGDGGQAARRAAGDLFRDRVMRALDRFGWTGQLLLVPLLWVGGELAASAGVSASGLSWLVWGLALRTVLVYHITWFVNSATHTWGYRNFATSDGSTNLWWVALVSWGEGWHNNHHAHQRSAAHGLRWFEFDPTYLTIRLLALVGLARDMVTLGPEVRRPWKDRP